MPEILRAREMCATDVVEPRWWSSHEEQGGETGFYTLFYARAW